MSNSHFMNSSGLDTEEAYNIMSARDLAILARATIVEHPTHYNIYSEREFTYNGITQPNRNTLLFRDRNIDGMKTGWTTAAGYCLVASGERDGMRLISVVMGTASEDARAAEIVTRGAAVYADAAVVDTIEAVIDHTSVDRMIRRSGRR
jgi:D-alanyl-D-alanine carboxypeptidase (penicillin-binding protein 5/6)